MSVPEMPRSSEYKRFADECRELARILRKPDRKQRLQEMAAAWEMLAVEFDAQLASGDQD